MTHESLEHELGRSEPERFNDLVTHRSRRRRGECHERHIRQHRAHRCEACIVRPKVVAPSGDAVSLVECDEREATRRIEHQEPVEQPVQRSGHRNTNSNSPRRACVSTLTSGCADPRKYACTPRLLRFATWSRIREMSGETTSAVKPLMSGGSWKHALLPLPVAESTRQSRPSLHAESARLCQSRSSEMPRRRLAAATCASSTAESIWESSSADGSQSSSDSMLGKASRDPGSARASAD